MHATGRPLASTNISTVAPASVSFSARTSYSTSPLGTCPPGATFHFRMVLRIQCTFVPLTLRANCDEILIFGGLASPGRVYLGDDTDPGKHFMLRFLETRKFSIGTSHMITRLLR